MYKKIERKIYEIITKRSFLKTKIYIFFLSMKVAFVIKII